MPLCELDLRIDVEHLRLSVRTLWRKCSLIAQCGAISGANVLEQCGGISHAACPGLSGQGA